MLGRMGKRVAATAAFALAGSTLLAMPAHAATKTIVIWSDGNRAAAIKTLFKKGFQGAKVTVITKDFGVIRDTLKTVSVANAPDVIIGAHDWTGQLVADGSVVKLILPAAVKKSVNASALAGFSYNGGVYGMPVQTENVALITNRTLIKTAPKNFSTLEAQAKAALANGATVGLAVPMGDAYHDYPLFSGLGGYIFGTTNGKINVFKLGVANKKFLSHASLIDKWVADGVISANVDYGTAKDAFVKGKAPFWITGPWEHDTIKGLSFPHTITVVPQIVTGITVTPFAGYQGFMVTKFAAKHGVATLAKAMVGNFLSTAAAQTPLASLNGRAPANLVAAGKLKDPIIKAFGAAGKIATPMPNVPEMAAVWGALGDAWKATSASTNPVPAAKAFTDASNKIYNLIN
jgi:arabinogalactan oligomer/maltooligosaccharide transport system substrate-binding protein